MVGTGGEGGEGGGGGEPPVKEKMKSVLYVLLFQLLPEPKLNSYKTYTQQ